MPMDDQKRRWMAGVCFSLAMAFALVSWYLYPTPLLLITAGGAATFGIIAVTQKRPGSV